MAMVVTRKHTYSAQGIRINYLERLSIKNKDNYNIVLSSASLAATQILPFENNRKFSNDTRVKSKYQGRVWKMEQKDHDRSRMVAYFCHEIASHHTPEL